jgi:hypothetical protein
MGALSVTTDPSRQGNWLRDGADDQGGPRLPMRPSPHLSPLERSRESEGVLLGLGPARRYWLTRRICLSMLRPGITGGAGRP